MKKVLFVTLFFAFLATSSWASETVYVEGPCYQSTVQYINQKTMTGQQQLIIDTAVQLTKKANVYQATPDNGEDVKKQATDKMYALYSQLIDLKIDGLRVVRQIVYSERQMAIVIYPYPHLLSPDPLHKDRKVVTPQILAIVDKVLCDKK